MPDVTSAPDDRSNPQTSHEWFAAYSERLRKLARVLMARQRVNHTLQTTALVAEAYLRQGRDGSKRWESPEHFVNSTVQSMKHCLVDHARTRGAQKRTADRWPIAPLDLNEADQVIANLEAQGFLVTEVVAELDNMERMGGAMAQAGAVGRLRLLGNISLKEIASLQDRAYRSTKRDWSRCRQWLSETL